MVGYDFDKTIYKHDSSIGFFLYMVFTQSYLLLFFPWFLLVVALYGMKILSKKKTKECLFFFVPWYKNIDKIVNKFWAKNANKIQDWYSRQKRDDDIIISASPEFLLKPVMEMLSIKNFIATNFDTKTGKIIGENCYGETKKNQFESQFGKVKLEAFYSDSLSDLPMMKISDKAYLVEKGIPRLIDVNEIRKK